CQVYYFNCLLFFFFQAEDGIRDDLVTGVQTCALPICSVSDHVPYAGSSAYAASKYGLRGMHEVLRTELARTGVRTTLVSPGPVRSEERRVGKEGRCRRSPWG